MRLAATVRHSAYIIACLASATFASEAGAADAAQIRTDLAAVLDQTFNTPAEPALVYQSIDIAGDTAPFDVTIRGVRLGTESEGFVEVGDVAMTIAPAGEGLYDVTNLKIPTPLTHRAPADAPEGAGEVDVTIEVAEQSFSGQWSMPLRSFLTFDGKLAGLRAMDGEGNVVLSLGAAVLDGDTTDKGGSRWDQIGTFTLTDMHVTNPEDGVVVDIAEVSAGTEARDIDLVTFQAMMDKMEAAGLAVEQELSPMPGEEAPAADPAEDGAQATEPEPATDDPNVSTDQAVGASESDQPPAEDVPAADETGDLAEGAMTPAQAQAMQEVMQALQGIPNSIGDAASNFSVRGLSVKQPDGKEMFKLDSGALVFSVSDLDQEKSGMRFAYSHGGLDADWNIFNSSESEGDFTFDAEGNLIEPEATEPEPLDAETEKLIEALAPRDIGIDIQLADVPSKQLWNTFVSTMYSSASEGGGGAMELEMMGMMLPMMLAQAGSTVRVVDTTIASQTTSLAIDGEVKADPASMMGASGRMTVEITGLDALIALVKDYVGPEGAADLAPLEMLRAFGERQQATGQTVDRYVVDLEPNGALMVNGKDMNFLLGMGGGGGEMPGDMPEDMPQDMPETMPSDTLDAPAEEAPAEQAPAEEAPQP